MFSRRFSAVQDFDDWLASLPIRSACVISPGNHEAYLASDPTRRSFTPHAEVLIGEGTNIQGLNIWASPVTPLACASFGIPRSEDRARYYAQIPVDTHVLITHGPPYGILDSDVDDPRHQGDPELLAAVLKIKPRLHIFGHIHGGHGIHVTEDTTFINAAVLGPDGGIQYEPTIQEINHV